ncbi:MAG: YihA family ribosome biogenesis GTP-binding protein [Blastochloris sp.]|nr:YihA family ribosome biogenesis GTP-binding protein [Blastochloris sp.]
MGKNCEDQKRGFFSSAPKLRDCPRSGKQEFAFIGRSNVGKSSLINMLMGRKDLAKVSAVPGKTRLINFFLMNESWFLVDLPGYGYAKVAQEDRAKFSESVAEYLARRETLSFVFVLIDARIPPQAIDLDFMGWITERNLPHGLVLTKTEKLSETKIQQARQGVLEAMGRTVGEEFPVFVTSSAQGRGKVEILGWIGRVLERKEKEAGQI